LSWEWYDHAPTKILFLHLLLKANHKDVNWRGINLKKGSFITGRKKLSDETGLSEQSIRTALKNLQSTNEITIKPQKNFSIISMVKWSSYQGNQPTINQRSTNDQPTINQQLTTDNNDNNDNNIDKKNKTKKVSKPDDVDEDVWRDWLQLRKNKGAVVSERVLSIVRKNAEQVQMTMQAALEKMIEKNWRGFQAKWIINEREQDAKRNNNNGGTGCAPHQTRNADSAWRDEVEHRARLIDSGEIF